MAEGLLAPINSIVNIVDKLLNEDILNKKQEIFLLTIEKEALSLQSLAKIFVEQEHPKAKDNLVFYGQSHLASISGYIEVLLKDKTDALADSQRGLLSEVRSSTNLLVEEIKRISD